MKKINFGILIFLLVITSCRNKKDKSKDYFPVLSFIKSQVAHVDTSLYPIIKIIRIDSTTDTSYIRREDFRKEARDFLDLPDLAEKKYSKLYTEDRIYDESMNRVIITYLSAKDDLDIQRQEVVIAPGNGEEDKVKSFIINIRKAAGDSTIIKKLLWLVNESFQVVTTVQKNNQPDFVTTTEVIWNRSPDKEEELKAEAIDSSHLHHKK